MLIWDKVYGVWLLRKRTNLLHLVFSLTMLVKNCSTNELNPLGLLFDAIVYNFVTLLNASMSWLRGYCCGLLRWS